MKLSFTILLSLFLFSSCNFSSDENKTDANKKRSQLAIGMSSGKIGIVENDKQGNVIVSTDDGISVGLGVGVKPPGPTRRGRYQAVLPPTLVSQLVSATMGNDLHRVREILVSGDYGWTELMEAVYKNDSAKVERLIKRGANVNAKTWGGMTALALAVQFENITIVKKLVEVGASRVEQRGLAIREPLAFAVDKGNEKIAALLLETGLDPKREWTAFIAAVKNNMINIVKLMLKKGLDLRGQDKRALFTSKRALMLSIGNENKEMALLLIKHGIDVNAVDKPGESPLSYAAKTGRIEMVKMLLENGVDLNRHGEKSMTEALLNGQIKITELLRENGVALELDSEIAAEILMKAASSGNSELMEYLFKKNAELSTEDLNKAVNSAVYDGQIAIAISIAKKLKQPAKPTAEALLYINEEDGNCEINIWDIETRSSKQIYTAEKCPDLIKDELFLDDDANSILISIGNTIQEIVYSPVVKAGPVINLPFEIGSRVNPEEELTYERQRFNRLSRAGHLSDGRLAIINTREGPADRSSYDLLLWVFDKGKWEMTKKEHCPFNSYCTFGELTGHTLEATRREAEITHPSVVFNPYVVNGGVLETTDSLFPYQGRDSEWRYVTFSVNERETTVYFNAVEGSHSANLLTFQLFIKSRGDSEPVQLTDSQCATAIEGRYLLLHKYFRGGMHLIDLETGETLISAKNYAAWLYN